MPDLNIIEVALPTPLARRFDYLAPEVAPQARVGARIKVPFGRRELVGIVTALKTCTQVPRAKLKSALLVVDESPIFSEAMLDLLQWASRYYHYPLGEVFAAALPKWLREGRDLDLPGQVGYTLSPEGRRMLDAGSARAKRQGALLGFIGHSDVPVSKDALTAAGFSAAVFRALFEKGALCESAFVLDGWDAHAVLRDQPLTLNGEQALAVQAVNDTEVFSTYLLEGVTGSGKTEVYLQAIATTLARSQQALVLIPEISLTPQTVARFEARFRVPIAVMHSRMSDGARAGAWRKAQKGQAAIVIGTRSAVFVPMPNLGLIVMDEEHDGSFVQQSGFRYSARDIAVMRAKLADIPIILGSATPSLQTLANVSRGRYQHLVLSERARAQNPVVCQLVDLREQHLDAGLTQKALAAISAHLDQGHQVMVFINRRGFAPTLMCHHCGWALDCTHCDAHMTWHESVRRAICHHCGRRHRVARVCPGCSQSDLSTVGAGTEQIEQRLCELFPEYRVLRVDRDTTGKKNSFSDMLDKVVRREVDILVGTQMLAKGHHFPHLMLVVMVNMDSGLYSADLGALEQMGQLMVQVAGRAGREHGQGEVLIQTHQPGSPLLKALLESGYAEFAKQLLQERKEAHLPPFTTMARFQVEAISQSEGGTFLEAVRQKLLTLQGESVQILGPFPSMMERRAGKYQYELVLLCPVRAQLHQLLSCAHPFVEGLRKPKGLSWSLQLVF
jgi:primosomal protein N' (replication factor Y) (superfamily II helicase)